MTDLIPKPPRRMKQPTKDALRQKIKDQAEELERLRCTADERDREIFAILNGERDDEIFPPPPYRWWRHLFGLRCQPKDKS